MSQALTSRESQLIECLKLGLTNRQVASRLGLAEGTVKIYCMRVFRKTGMGRMEVALSELRAENDMLRRENARLAGILNVAPIPNPEPAEAQEPMSPAPRKVRQATTVFERMAWPTNYAKVHPFEQSR